MYFHLIGKHGQKQHHIPFAKPVQFIREEMSEEVR